ncbi:TolC family protein, partial [bacterium]
CAYTLDEVYALAEKNLEEIRLADEGLGKAKAMLRAARYENLPEPSLGLSYGENGGARFAGLTLSFMLPAWGEKNSGRLASAEADIEKMSSMGRAARNDARAMVAEAWFALKNARRLNALYDNDLLKQALAAAQSAESLFRQGKGTISDYAEALSAYYNFSLARERALADSQKALARLEKLAGVDLTARADRDGAQK